MDITTLVALLHGWSAGTKPLYRRLADAMSAAIDAGDLAPGARLPAERELASGLAVSRSTIASAYDELEAAGLIERRHGSGTRVRRLVQDSNAAAFAYAAAFVRSPSLGTTVEGERGVINFTAGAPSGADHVPLDGFTMDADDVRSLIVHRGYVPLGHEPLRRAIAGRFSDRGVATSAKNILLTTGAQQAIALTAALYVRPGDAVLMENPTYFGAIDAYRAAGARCIPLAVDSEGARPWQLDETISANAPRLIYLTPTFQNPTGSVMPQHRRREFARIAGKHRLPLVEDETLADLTLGTATPAPIAAHERDATVISIGSFSKLIWAGLRVGWMRAPEDVIARLARMKAVADLGSSPLTQSIAARLCERLTDIRAMRSAQLTLQRDCMAQGLRALLPSFTWTLPSGGFFLWARLPLGSAVDFSQLALRHGVRITPGPAMSIDGTQHEAIRLSYIMDVVQIDEGLRRLAAAWRAYIAMAPHARSLDEPLV